MPQRLASLAMLLLSPVTWAILVVNSAILATLIIVLSLLGVRGRAFDGFGTFWGRVTLWTAGVRVRVDGLQHLAPGQPYVLMANHQSFHDVWALFGYLPLHFRWVIKQELRRIPVFGLGCVRMGHIFVDRGHSARARASLQLAGERIRAGTSVAFFPEGTRSRNGRVGPFKKGGFHIALEAQVPILPITIHGSGRLFPSGGLRFRPGLLRITIHPPLDLRGLGPDDRDALMERVRGIIAAPPRGPAGTDRALGCGQGPDRAPPLPVLEVADDESRSLRELLNGLDAVPVSAEVRAVLDEHVRDRPTGVFGRKEHGLGSWLGLKDAVVSRGACTLRVPLVDLARGSMCVLVGPNGSGKSIFLDALMDDDSVTLDLQDGAGSLVMGTSTRLTRKARGLTRLARLDQEEILGAIAGLCALDTLRQGLRYYLDQFPVDDARWGDPDGYEQNLACLEAQQRIGELASALYGLFGMHACAQVPVRGLSGGERTKLSLMLVMMSDADVALFDEPTNHLDDAMRQLITQALVDFAARGGGVLLSTHDLDLMQALEANRALSLRLDTFERQDGRTTIRSFQGSSISAHVQARIGAARTQGARAV